MPAIRASEGRGESYGDRDERLSQNKRRSHRCDRRQRPVRHAGPRSARRAARRDPLRRTFGSLRPGEDRRSPGGVPGSPRARPPPLALGAQLPRQHLRFQGSGRRMADLGERRRLDEGRIPAAPHLWCPDQFYDRTRHRQDTFFGDGLVAHVSMADPVCPVLAGELADAAGAAGATVHRGGTYLCMEGPQFSTRAESEIYRGWGVDVIGMTNLQEAKLAREAEICYSTLAMVTDYYCWHESEEDQRRGPDQDPASQRRDHPGGGAAHRRRSLGRAPRARPLPVLRSPESGPHHRPRHHPGRTTLERLAPIVGKYLDVGTPRL